jgi:hypothetical protein
MAEEEIVVPYSQEEHLKLCAASEARVLAERGQSGRRVGFICFVHGEGQGRWLPQDLPTLD